MKQLLMLAITALFLILVISWGQQAAAGTTVGVDHFKCYKVIGDAPKPAQTHTVDDEFENAESDTIGEPALICNPVAKTSNTSTTPIINPQGHLACYKVKGQHKLTSMVAVRVDNQLGTQDLKVAKQEGLLCVPSSKTCLNDTNKWPNQP